MSKPLKPWSRWLIAAGAYPGFSSMKRLGVFLLPVDGMLVHRRSLPRNFLGFSNNFPVPIYTPGWREALRKLSVLPKNTVSTARARTRTACSGHERTNHEATAPPTVHPSVLRETRVHSKMNSIQNSTTSITLIFYRLSFLPLLAFVFKRFHCTTLFYKYIKV